MNWNRIENEQQIESIKENSQHKLQLIFKHSTRCIISKMALKSFEEGFSLKDHIELHFLDLIANRSLSNKIADDFEITHQSPQILLIKNGVVVYNESHEGINVEVLKGFV